MSTTDAKQRSEYFPFIDWMKAAGILLIVVGHVAARTSDWLMPPIYPKQLGVAFFLFVTGYTLAREHRPASRVLFNRLFEVYFYGIALAILWSMVTLIAVRDPAESNYLPFLGGLNVLFNFFPANPTTWYVGTYLHILLLWAFVLRGVRMARWMLLVVCVAEVMIRGVLIERIGGVLPYMLLSNWIFVFLLGLYFGQQHDHVHLSSSSWTAGAMLLAIVLLWHISVADLVTGNSFPWMAAAPALGPPGPWIIASLITFLYSVVTVLAFKAVKDLRAPSAVRALSRHTLFIFLAHMPLFYALRPLLEGADLSYGVRSAVYLTLCLPGLAVLSRALNRLLRPQARRDELVAAFATFRRQAA